MRKIFKDNSGAVRIGWLIAAAAGAYLLADGGVYDLYWYLYRTMMSVWGVNSGNIARAPAAVQLLFSWSNVIVRLLQSAAICGAAVWLKRISQAEKKESTESCVGAMGKGAGIGAALTVGAWAILMLTGSVRLGWRLSRPEFSVNTLALTITALAAAVSEGVFLYGTLRELVKRRLPGWAANGVMCAWSVVFLLMDGEVQPTALVSGALSVLVMCGLTERYGAAAAVGFLFSRSWLEQAVFGFAGAAGALYETYPVNLYWLNGGNAGLRCGALMIVTLAGLAMWLYREKLQSLLRKAKRT